jgi:hypothetical protein
MLGEEEGGRERGERMGYMLMYCMIMNKDVPHLSLSSHLQ